MQEGADVDAGSVPLTRTRGPVRKHETWTGGRWLTVVLWASTARRRVPLFSTEEIRKHHRCPESSRASATRDLTQLRPLTPPFPDQTHRHRTRVRAGDGIHRERHIGSGGGGLSMPVRHLVLAPQVRFLRRSPAGVSLSPQVRLLRRVSASAKRIVTVQNPHQACTLPPHLRPRGRKSRPHNVRCWPCGGRPGTTGPTRDGGARSPRPAPWPAPRSPRRPS